MFMKTLELPLFCSVCTHACILVRRTISPRIAILLEVILSPEMASEKLPIRSYRSLPRCESPPVYRQLLSDAERQRYFPFTLFFRRDTERVKSGRCDVGKIETSDSLVPASRNAECTKNVSLDEDGGRTERRWWDEREELDRIERPWEIMRRIRGHTRSVARSETIFAQVEGHWKSAIGSADVYRVYLYAW